MSNARQLTRDLLLEYDIAIVPPRPRAAGLGMIYPWENLPLTVFSQQLFQFAKQSGFMGSEHDFITKFGYYLGGRQIIFDDFINFPENGEEDKLYFDLDEKILYYWDNNYIPVNAMLIANTIIDGGEA